MKSIKFNLSENFNLVPILSNRIFELENNSCLMEFVTVVDPEMVYELHIERNTGEKFLKVLDKNIDGSVSIKLTSSILAKTGSIRIQVKGVKDHFVIESNAIELDILTFINASDDIPEKEQSEFEKLIIKVEGIDAHVKIIDSELLDYIQKFEYLVSDVENISNKVDSDEAAIRDLEKDFHDVSGELENKANKSDIPTLVSQLENDSNFVNQNYVDNNIAEVIGEIEAVADVLPNKANKNDVYTKEQTNALLDTKASTGTVEALNTNLRSEINKKQDKLVAGSNISIDGNVISSTGGGEGDVTKKYLEDNYYDKQFFEDISTLEIEDDKTPNKLIEEKDICYSSLPTYCGKWLGDNLYRRVYVVNSGIAKGNEIKVADKPSNMKFCPFITATIVGANSANNVMTNSDCRAYVNDNGIFVVNNFTSYCDRIYVTMEYTVGG